MNLKVPVKTAKKKALYLYNCIFIRESHGEVKPNLKIIIFYSFDCFKNLVFNFIYIIFGQITNILSFWFWNWEFFHVCLN